MNKNIKHIFTVYAVENEQVDALKIILKAMKIKYEITDENPCKKNNIGNTALQNESKKKRGKREKVSFEEIGKLW